MRVLAHVDPVVLERELLKRVDAAHPERAVARTLVLVPTHRLAAHVQRKLADLRPAWLGLQVFSFHALAGEILRRETGSAPRVASPLLLEALLRRQLRRKPGNLWSEFVSRRPGAVGRLIATMRELGEAGIEPAELAGCAEDPRTRDLAELYALYRDALRALQANGWTDDADLARAASPHAAVFGKSLSAVFVHGAYELLGVNLELLREIERTCAVSLLVPVAAGSRATAYGERFAHRFLTDGPPESLATTDADRAARLASLYDEEAAPAAAGPEACRFHHAQGAAAEVEFAVRTALRAVRDGCPPSEIAIVARALEPYAAAFEEALDDAELPWTSSLASPLRRQPVVREFLLLLSVLARDFPRDDVVALLQSRYVDWPAIGCDGTPSAARADRWSRRAGIIGGLDEWIGELEERAADDETDAGGLVAALRALDRLLPRDSATWSEQAGGMLATFDTAFGREPSDAAEQLRGLLRTMAELEHALGDRREVDLNVALGWLEEAVDSEQIRRRREDDGGIRVLDAMQLRGLTFRHVHLLGLNSGLFSAAPREDPLLPDEVRCALRERTGKPIGVKGEATDEEHQLLAAVLGAARERLDVSWQRADESGRARSVSLALREIARLARGRPEIDRLREEATHLPSHPRQWLETLLDETGLLSPGEERLLAALHGRPAKTAERLGRRFPELSPGLEMLRATESFTPLAPDYDGRIGPSERASTLSVSAIETLGRCPLRFFFDSVLGVRALDPAPSPLELASDERGRRIHRLLEEVYEQLREEGRFTSGSADALRDRSLALIDERRERLFGERGERLAARIPRLWAMEGRRWYDAVRRFVADDLRCIGAYEPTKVELERTRTERIDLGGNMVASVRGRFDRRLEGADGVVVGDYKTSTRLSGRMDPTQMLKAQTLQVPLYRMMAGGEAVVELLGVHPDLDPAVDDYRHAFAGFDRDDATESFRRTLRVLLGLRRDGVYPFHPEDRKCTWCDYRRACRRSHPPSLDRESQRSDAAAYRNVLTKNKTRPDGR